MPEPVRVCLRVAANAAERDAAIAVWTRPADGRTGGQLVLAEGLLLDRLHDQSVPVIALGTGCPCCTGIVHLRVLLTRNLRTHRPARVLMLLAGDSHLPRVRRVLASGELGIRFEVDG